MLLGRLRSRTAAAVLAKTAIPEGAWALHSAEDLLAPLSSSLTRLAERADATEAHFAHYYQPVLNNLAEYLQQLPSVEQNSTLLAICLPHTEVVLQRRWAYLLPPGAEPERLAQEADIWTYAVFTLSLLRGLAAELSCLQVELLDDQGSTLGHWKPWLGAMSAQGASYYRIHSVRSHSSCNWSPVLAARVVPQHGQQWLWSQRSVFSIWLEALSGPCPAVLAPLLSSAGTK